MCWGLCKGMQYFFLGSCPQARLWGVLPHIGAQLGSVLHKHVPGRDSLLLHSSWACSHVPRPEQQGVEFGWSYGAVCHMVGGMTGCCSHARR